MVAPPVQASTGVPHHGGERGQHVAGGVLAHPRDAVLGLLSSGQITMRKIKGWQSLGRDTPARR